MNCSLYYIRVGHGDGNFFEDSRCSAPLQSVCATGIVRDSVAQFTLAQTFVNPHKDVGIEAVYEFPLYEGVAVRGFKAEVDGRKMVGRVQEKVAARKEFKEAVEEGKIASLLEQERPDVFQTSVGNIPPGTTPTKAKSALSCPPPLPLVMVAAMCGNLGRSAPRRSPIFSSTFHSPCRNPSLRSRAPRTQLKCTLARKSPRLLLSILPRPPLPSRLSTRNALESA